MTNRRRDPRFPLPGLQVEIRWPGAGQAYQACRLVDLSSNGLAFVSHDGRLAPLDKVGFRLHIGGRRAGGKAVICYRAVEGGGLWRYGGMFLEVSPEVETLLQEVEVDPTEVRAVARLLAEEMVLESYDSERERNRLRRQLLLQEAVNAWLGRLQELGYQPPMSVTLDLDGGVRLEGSKAVTIVAVPGQGGYVADSGEHFTTVFEVLEFLRECFSSINQTAR